MNTNQNRFFNSQSSQWIGNAITKEQWYLAAYFFISLISWKMTNYAAAQAAVWLGPELFGDFSVSIRLSHNLAHLFIMGQEATLLLFLSKYIEQPEKQSGLVQWIYQSTLIKTLLLFIAISVLYWLTPMIAAQFGYSIDANILIGLSAMPFIAISGIYERFFLFLKKFFTSFVSRGIAQPIIFLCLLKLSAVYLYSEKSPFIVISLYSISYLITAGIYAITGMSSTFKLSKNKDRSDQPLWHASGLLYTLSTLIIKSTPSIAIYFMESLSPNEAAVGYFGAIATLIYGYHLLTKPFESYLKPAIAELFHLGKIDELQKKINYINKIRWVIIILLTAFFIIRKDTLLGNYGETFLEASGPLALLACFSCIQYLGQPANEILNYTGNQGSLSFIMTIQFVLIALLCKLLIPTMGMWGAVIAQGIPSILAVSASSIILYRKTKLKLYFLF